MNTRSSQSDVAAIVVILTCLMAGSFLVGGLGAINYLNGHFLRASATLLVPAFLTYWAWEGRGTCSEAQLIIPIAAFWFCGLSVGFCVHEIGRMIA